MSQPAHKIRIGNLTATIWRNFNSEKGTTWYSTSPISRSYTNDDGEWRDTDNLGFDDQLLAAKLHDLTHTWIAQAMKADYEARKNRLKEQQQAAAA